MPVHPYNFMCPECDERAMGYDWYDYMSWGEESPTISCGNCGCEMTIYVEWSDPVIYVDDTVIEEHGTEYIDPDADDEEEEEEEERTPPTRRCENCKHYDSFSENKGVCFNSSGLEDVNADGYCSQWRRQEEK